MRRIAYIFLGLALVGAATWFCSSDAPGPTPPKTGGPGANGASALQIRLFTSNANPVAGTCTLIQAVVTLNGANAPDGTGVAFSTDLPTSVFQQNGLALISVVTQGGTTTTALCSTGAGLATVRATSTIGSETGTATIQIAFQPSPLIAPFFTFCAPSFGTPLGGTTLVINGGRFFGDPTTTRATFTAAGITREALVTAVTATAVTLVTPAFPEASSPSVPVAITLTFGTKTTAPVTLSLPNCFSFGTATPATPTITAVLPSSGLNDGNTRVTIIGSGFVAPLQVFFGVVEAQVLSVSFNQIIVLTPPASGAGLPNLNSSVTVRVHEVTSGLDATLPNGFRFVTKAQITAADNTQQRVDQPFTPVTIHGQGFLSPVAVTLAGIPAKVISVSATELLVLPGTPFLTACTDISGPIAMVNIDSGDPATGPDFIYQVAVTKPIITGVSPSSGPPGTTVTISGANLGNVTSVSFGGRAALIASVSDGTIVVTVPDSGDSALPCPAGTPAGTPLAGTSAAVTVTSALTTCSATSAGAFQYKLPCTVPPTLTPPFTATATSTPTVTPTSTPTPTLTPTPTVTPVVGTADLVLSKSASPSTVVSGSLLTYQLGVTNNGPGSSTAVVLTDPLPAGTTFQSCTTSQGSCLGPAVNANGTVVASLGNISSPGFALVRIIVMVTAPGGSSINNTAVVSSATFDPSLLNNTASAGATVSSVSADLAVLKTGFPDPAFTGKTLTYTITVNNNGPSSANTVELSDPLPPNTTLASVPTTSRGFCQPTPIVGTNGTVRCELGLMAPSDTATITIVVNVNVPGGSSVTNTASVTSNTLDPNLLNNSSTVTIIVNP